MDLAIKTDGLSRSFQSVRAVDDLHLAVPRGAVFGFLGPNGAGKTTTIRMLLGLIRPSQGRVWLNGHDIATSRRTALSGVGAIVESPALYPNLTGRETLLLAARVGGHPTQSAYALLEQVQLTGAMDRLVSQYSLGMRQRLALARAMLGQPGLLILDEPTNGLDPQGIADMRALIRRLPEDHGATVLVSSHLLHEIEQTATHCALIHHGSLLFQGTLAELSDTAPPTLVIETQQVTQTLTLLRNLGLSPDGGTGQVRVALRTTPDQRAELLSALIAQGIGVSGLWEDRATLESVFFDLTEETKERAP